MIWYVSMCSKKCCRSRLEWDQLLEQHQTLQDSFDQLQAEARFEADRVGQQLQDRQQEIDEMKAQIMVSDLINCFTLKCMLSCPISCFFSLLKELSNSLETEQKHTSTLTSQLRENRESTSKWVYAGHLFVYICLWTFIINISLFTMITISTWLTLYAFRELTENEEENTQLRKKVSDLTLQNQQQVSPVNSMHSCKS